MQFEDWLAAEGLSSSTVKKYAGAIDGALTKWSIENKITSKPIRTVIDPDEFSALSELIEGTEIFAERNLRGNHMYGAALKNYAKYLAHVAYSSSADLKAVSGPFDEQVVLIAQNESQLQPFDPRDQNDGREHVLRDVVRRQGQPKFRSVLIAAYEGRCAITDCPVLVVLEAAHVTPYLGPHTNAVSNGLLLRADIHTLWDLGFIAIDPMEMTVAVNPKVQDPNYLRLEGSSVFQPVAIASRASHAALTQQWSLFQTHLARGL